MGPGVADVRIELLGGLRVVARELTLTERDFPSRRARELVALLALAEGRRLPRDHVVEQLWPHLGARAGGANLRKAAHHARRTLGDPDAVRLRDGAVELYPGRAVACDVHRFLADAEDALRDGDEAACARVAATCQGQLLPDALYETWTQDPRRRVRDRLAELLRRSGAWEQLLELEPTDEAACEELMRAAIDAGRRHAAIRWYERLRVAMVRELGRRPGPGPQGLYDLCTAGVRLDEHVFVGRELELAGAMGELGRTAGGGTAALIVRGPTGIGKSALCREIAQRARHSGWRVLAATGTVSGAPYDPVAAVIEQLLADGRPSPAALPARTRSILAALSPLAGPAPDPEGPVTRHQVVAALRRALALPGEARPTLLWVEDAHLCDAATADVLHQLVAGGGGPLLLMLAIRAEWMRTSLPRGLAELARADGTHTVALGPLDDGSIARLVELAASAPLTPATIARIARDAEGSPFFASELARAPATDDPGRLPETVREAIAQRLDGLPAPSADALTMLAVSDGELDLASVLALTGLGEHEASVMLDGALEAGILIVAGAHYRFRHELVRQALTDDLPQHRRLALHRGAAGRLAASGASPALVAHHWLRGERPGEAVGWQLAAARHAVRVGAFADALAHVERLLTHAPTHRDALCLRAEILDALGDARAPHAYATAADAIGEPQAQELRARQALAQLKASDPAGALRTLEGVRPRTTAGRLAEALTLSAAAAIGVYADADAAAAKAEEAHRLALRLGDPGAILDATWAHALAAHAKGELPARLRDYLRATHELPELATRVFDGQLCVTERMLHGGLPNEEVIAFADGLAAEAQRLGAARGHAFALTLRGEAEILAGRLDEADRDFAEGARLHGRIGAAAGEALSLLGRAQVATYRGRPELARPLLADALLLARESEVGHHTLDRIYGAMVEGAGDPARAVELVREAETAIRGPAETCPTCRIAFIVPAAIAAARAMDLDRAQRYTRDCETAIEVVALPPAWHAAVDEVRGWGARADGSDEVAREHFRSAAGRFGACAQPLDAQRCAVLAQG
jgi:DNA-binding SARP family transcriptional activator/tetratricopeptide (TPR) repeat protein